MDFFLVMFVCFEFCPSLSIARSDGTAARVRAPEQTKQNKLLLARWRAQK
jgi:hypothetical protein